jgi:predicted dithiol-disulfide oxidoreductase (DUF899 family)
VAEWRRHRPQPVRSIGFVNEAVAGVLLHEEALEAAFLAPSRPSRSCRDQAAASFLLRILQRPGSKETSKMTTDTIPHPPIVSREDWLGERKKLLTKEKELLQLTDRINAERRRLPMVRVDKGYTFDGPNGRQSLEELFDGRRQLIVYHFMFDPSWDKGCMGCTGFVDALGDLSMLGERDTTFVLVSRAPLAKLETYKVERGWDVPWFSSFGSDFNYDFHATLDPSVAPVEYNFRDQAEWEAKGEKAPKGEAPGLSVFFRLGDQLFHTYSAYARGVESVTDAYALLDRTPYGRQEDFEDSPAGWPQKPTYG